MPRRLVLLALAPVALAAVACGGSKPAGHPQVGAAVSTTNHARPGGQTNVAYDDCTKAAVRPSRIVIACGTGAEYLRGARYGSYGRASASGSAELVADDCRPDCARGRFVGHRARFLLTRPVECRDGRRYYSRVVATPIGGPKPGPRSSDFPIAPLSC